MADPELESYRGWYLTERGDLLHAPRNTLTNLSASGLQSYCGRHLRPIRTDDHQRKGIKHTKRCQLCRTMKKRK